jgi:hypothetical protein
LAGDGHQSGEIQAETAGLPAGLYAEQLKERR